ncbi:MAG: ABC transporter ATP-binding protein [Alphaproteobacteria bacterium]
MNLLSIKNLSLTFRHDGRKVEAVKHVSLEMGKGEFLAIVGESGSGKSLTALSCMGLQPKAAAISGSIQFAGQEVIGAPDSILRSVRGNNISMVFQEPMTALNPLHTVEKQLGEMLRIHNNANHSGRILELLESVGLGHFKDRLNNYPHQLSGGERQRVMIAMAMANNPKLLIADEPTTAVDVTIQAKILKLLKELQAKHDLSIMLITHDLTIVKRLADRVAIMKQGEIVEQGKVSQIFAAPKHPYTQKLLASEPKGSAAPLPADAAELIQSEELKVHFPIRGGVFGRVKDYVKAVDGISIGIKQGETLGLVGESGSGKTTLAMALLRMIPSTGRIVFMGQNIDELTSSKVRPLRQHMQLVFQDPFASLNPRMTIQQIIEEGLLVHEPNLSAAERTQKVGTILHEVGLPADITSRFAHEFSGGQRQRISIARAMVLNPSFVVMDEPTSALDLTVQSTIIDLLKDLQKKHGLGYIFISHDLRVVKAISHRIAVLYKGKIVEVGPTTNIIDNPQEEYTAKLIKAAMLR